jgi:DNA-binding response OmpR family regulator
MPRAVLAIAHWPLRELYRTILERQGYGVGEAEMDEGVLDQVAEDPPDLVVVCADDPRVRGKQTVGQLVRDPRIRQHGTAFLALTTHDMHRSQVSEAGFTDCLHLPASIHEITSTLEDIARRRLFGSGK